jgi:hypothetical protein
LEVVALLMVESDDILLSELGDGGTSS